MDRKIFFSKRGKGWFEEAVPEEEKHRENLEAWAYKQLDERGFKGFLITENPCPYILKSKKQGNERLEPGN